MDISDAIRCTLDGDGILFIGAGLSFLSRDQKDRKLPDAFKLIDLLLEQPDGKGSNHKLDRVAGAVARAKGNEFVYRIIKERFTVSKVDDRLKKLYCLPWKRIYTTNYDNAIEVGRQSVGRITSVTVDDPQSDAHTHSIVHLNGFVKRVSASSIDQGLLLTDASYAGSRLIETGWLSFFEDDINYSRTIIFAGYSLYDLEIDRVLLSADGTKRKAFFFIGPNADEIEISTLERYGEVIPGGIDKLVSLIEEIQRNYLPPTFRGGFSMLREIKHREERNIPSAQTLTNQLVYGVLPEQQVLGNTAAFGDQPFLVMREQIQNAVNALSAGPWRDILFIGEIASGKSAAALLVSNYLIQEGYKVFYAVRGKELVNELRRLAEQDEKTCVIFDGYGQFRDEIRDYVARRRLDQRIIITERSATHDFVGSFISTTKGLGPVRETVLDKIALKDVAGFEALTNFGGFWGSRAGSTADARRKHISGALDGSLYRLLIEIIESENVQQKIQELLRPIGFDVRAASVFISALIVTALGFEFTISEWLYLFDRQLVLRLMNNYAEQVRNFLLSDSDHIFVRNGLLSKNVLHAFRDDDLVKQCLVNLYERAEKYAVERGKWDRLRIEMIRFGAIETMFHGAGAKVNILSYYDQIRVYGKTKDNPDYWLQVGIAATVHEDLERAKLCFDNAYARERAKRNPNLTKIDNYYSRFQMRQAVAEADANEAFRIFIEGGDRLEKQIFLDTNRHYPFKTGRSFTEIAAKHFASWDTTQQDRFIISVEKIRDKAEAWRAKRRQANTDVNILIRETTSLLESLRSSNTDENLSDVTPAAKKRNRRN